MILSYGGVNEDPVGYSAGMDSRLTRNLVYSKDFQGMLRPMPSPGKYVNASAGIRSLRAFRDGGRRSVGLR